MEKEDGFWSVDIFRTDDDVVDHRRNEGITRDPADFAGGNGLFPKIENAVVITTGRKTV